MSQKFDGRIKYVSRNEAAQIIGVSRGTLSYWRSENLYLQDLPTKLFGKRVYYRLADVREFAKKYHPYARLDLDAKPRIERRKGWAALEISLDQLVASAARIKEQMIGKRG